MQTNVTSCDICLAEIPPGRDGWFFHGQEGDVDYTSHDFCSLECAEEGLTQLRAILTGGGRG